MGSDLGDLLSFESFNLKEIGKKIGDEPWRLLTGVDPASTGIWNGVLGKDSATIVDQFGGASKDTYTKAEAKGINTSPARGMHDIAKAVASIYAVAGLGGIGNSAPATEGGAGGSSTAGSSPGLSSNMPTMPSAPERRPLPQRVSPADTTLPDMNELVARYNSNQGAMADGHRIQVDGGTAFLHDADGAVVGQAPADGRLAKIIAEMEA